MRSRNGLGDHDTVLPQADGGPGGERHRREEAVDGCLGPCDVMRSGRLDPHRLHVQVFVELLEA